MENRKKVCVAILAISALLCLGMGDLGDDGVEIPKTGRNYSVRLVDRSGLSIDLERFSFEGKTFFYGKLGMANASVDFDKIRSVRFERGEDGKVVAEIELDNGETVSLVMKKSLACYGSSSVADIKIEIGDIDTIQMLGVTPAESQKGQ